MNDKIVKTLEFDKILHKLANHAATSLGKEWVEQLRPSSELEDVKTRLLLTDEAAAVDRLKGGAPFGGIRNIRSSLHRSRIGSILSASELLDIATTIYGGRRLARFLEGVNDQREIKALLKLSGELGDVKAVEDRIKSCISEDADVLDSASSELARIRQELRGSESRIRERLDQMIRNTSIQKMLQDNLVTLRGDRFVIPVKQEYRSQFGGIVHDQSASGATLFIEPEAVVQMNNKLRELRMKEEKEIDKILQMLSSTVAESADIMLANVEVLAELDFTFAKAGLARELKGTLPLMNDRGFLKIKKGRHPLISAEHVVPLDVELGNQFTSIIVTGPNTGGKTVSIKTIGLLSLMAMSGLFVPAEDGSQLCVFDAIYADIGDEQSIEQSLSTFSSHLTNIISILKGMTPKSLVLLDELGAGTDPAEGSALAIALLEYIHRMGCRIVATTHYSELKAYAFERKGVINASMEFDIQTIRPTYRLLVGVPGRSNAFAIAERLGLPRSIIEHARGHVGEDEARVETMIASLEANRASAEAERAHAEVARRETEQLRKQLEEQKQRFEEQRDKLLEKAENEAREAVARARREAETVLADLRRMALEAAGSVKEHRLIEARRRLDEAEPELRQKKAARPAARGGKAAVLAVGDEVRVLSLGQKGHIVDFAGEKEAVVQLGIMKMKVQRDDLERLGAAPDPVKQAQQLKASVKRTRDENVRMELDLRGSNVEEGISEVDRFLDEAFLANLGQVYIIHGKGTGVLRTGITEYLRRHKLVKSYRLGNYGEGGNGVTVVEIGH
ncbi:endonuclease MutS2 [Paenibacillus sp. y28]|uniref:endonuclease MutS2 n=1 Tax=Paenibacillus sp. y28 TaxID=3129110 RepID=UPI003017FDDA